MFSWQPTVGNTTRTQDLTSPPSHTGQQIGGEGQQQPQQQREESENAPSSSSSSLPQPRPERARETQNHQHGWAPAPVHRTAYDDLFDDEDHDDNDCDDFEDSDDYDDDDYDDEISLSEDDEDECDDEGISINLSGCGRGPIDLEIEVRGDLSPQDVHQVLQALHRDVQSSSLLWSSSPDRIVEALTTSFQNPRRGGTGTRIVIPTATPVFADVIAVSAEGDEEGEGGGEEEDASKNDDNTGREVDREGGEDDNIDNEEVEGAGGEGDNIDNGERADTEINTDTDNGEAVFPPPSSSDANDVDSDNDAVIATPEDEDKDNDLDDMFSVMEEARTTTSSTCALYDSSHHHPSNNGRNNSHHQHYNCRDYPQHRRGDSSSRQSDSEQSQTRGVPSHSRHSRSRNGIASNPSTLRRRHRRRRRDDDGHQGCRQLPGATTSLASTSQASMSVRSFRAQYDSEATDFYSAFSSLPPLSHGTHHGRDDDDDEDEAQPNQRQDELQSDAEFWSTALSTISSKQVSFPQNVVFSPMVVRQSSNGDEIQLFYPTKRKERRERHHGEGGPAKSRSQPDREQHNSSSSRYTSSSSTRRAMDRLTRQVNLYFGMNMALLLAATVFLVGMIVALTRNTS